MISNSSKFSILVDEATTLNKKAVLVIYFKVSIQETEPVFIFFDLVELDGQGALEITAAPEDSLQTAGFSTDFSQNNWIAFVSDGASVRLGKKSGVASRLCAKYPKLFTWLCLNHRLELAVGDAVHDITTINHFKAFMDTMYSLYSMSPKNTRELKEASIELETQLLRIGRVLDVRWVASSFRTVKAVWVSFEALVLHFQNSADDTTRDGKEKAKYSGLLKRLTSFEFISDLAIMYDALLELSILSQELQKRSMTLMQANYLINRTIRVIQSLKDTPGEKCTEYSKACEKGKFHNVTLLSNKKLQKINKDQFIQSLCLMNPLNSCKIWKF